MSTTEIWLLAFALAMDCLTVSLAAGIASRRLHPRRMTLMACLFGCFQGGMTVAGCLGTSLFSRSLAPFDHWIAFGLLTYLGVRMMIEDFRGEETQTGSLLRFRTMLLLSVATSIDALAVGVSFACLGMDTSEALVRPASIIAFVSFALTLAGAITGVAVGRKMKLPMEALGGLILIIIGTKILIEHLTAT